MPLYMSNEALRFSGRYNKYNNIIIINNVNENARLKDKYDSMAQVCHSHYRFCDAFSLHITFVDHVFWGGGFTNFLAFWFCFLR